MKHYILCLFAALMPAMVHAQATDIAQRPTLSARLITAERHVAPDARTLSAAIEIALEPGWKTYWRSPGEVGLPPELDWAASQNVSGIELLYPAPTRFTAFDIENFGYENKVAFPLAIELAQAGAPVELKLQLDLLVCEALCIPETVQLALAVPAREAATQVDLEAARLIGSWQAKVPQSAQAMGLSQMQAGLMGDTLAVSLQSEIPLRAPDIFTEGPRAAFGRPSLMLGDGGRQFYARIPITAPFEEGSRSVDVTLIDGTRAATFTIPLGQTPAAPAQEGRFAALAGMIALALLGGLILNVMPCVLPVLTLKLAGAMNMSGASQTTVRRGFLATGFGIVCFMWALGATLVVMQLLGARIGWGIQFQSPVFLSILLIVMALFTANLAGLFEINLPSGVNDRLARFGLGNGTFSDFCTGLLAALLATPCSAPFLGTAVAYALARGPFEIAVIFTALGFGLALPYFLVALRPSFVAHLPKPGAWMVHVKYVLAAVLALTTLWILSLIWGATGPVLTSVMSALVLALWGGFALRIKPALLAGGALALAAAFSIYVPHAPRLAAAASGWEAFRPDDIAQRVQAGEVVFVDLTADWCLTCQANKRLVLQSRQVAQALEAVHKMQGDWTRPDARIEAYLAANERFGIPFNKVYGPGAPSGIALPEVLTQARVLDALEAAAR